MRPMKTEAIKNFLLASTHADLAALYNHDMEVQVNVAQDGGERVDGEFKGRQWHGFSDGLTTWKPIRIPYKAKTEPEYTDSPIQYDLAEHAEGIGMTGWDWKNRVSRWVGFDFDAMTGHSEKHTKKLSDAELREVVELVSGIPWITVRKSTSGKGIHLYVFLEAFPTANHDEHAAVARSILGIMSGIVGIDFSLKVDACGGNMWVWHRKMKGTDGLSLVKSGCTFNDIPSNWRDHLNVIHSKRKKILPSFIEESDVPDSERIFEELTGQRSTVKLDTEHRRLITWLNDNGYPAIWDADHHMLITHTYGLMQAHEELQLRGIFKTLASGTERGDHNAFCFPLRRGAWAIRRYTPGVAEDATWDQDSVGYTRCYYNREPDLSSAARSSDGNEHPSGGFHFRHAEQAMKAAFQLGADVKLPPYMMARNAKLKEKDKKLVVEVGHENTDNPQDMQGWIQEGKLWKRVFHVQLSSPVGVETGNYDDLVRHVVTETGDDYGWVLQSDNQWRTEPLAHVKVALEHFDLGTKEVKAILGGSVFKPWTLVNRPFQPEYPGDRTWNRGAAQFRFHPSSGTDDLRYPHWSKILNHIGRGLDDAVKEDGWCRANGICTGADYLKVWIASLLQEPGQPLPYLFLYSPEQNTGKSILHEALGSIITKGVARADSALINQQGFNGELECAVLCVVEETDLRRNKAAYNRIKDWVTSRHIQIHYKGRTPYSIPNTTHWLQCSNDHQACFSGNTKIITKSGVATLKELAKIGHAELYVRTPSGMQWIDCSIQSFGVQETVPLRFGNGAVIRATKDHQWVIMDCSNRVDWMSRKLTYELEPLRTRVPLAPSNLPEMDLEGYAHGFIFGDGWERLTRGKLTTETHLHGHDNDLFKLLLRFGTQRNAKFESVLGTRYVNGVGMLPEHWKTLPKNPTKSYALGFVLGYVAADGSVDKSIRAFANNYSDLYDIRKLGIYAGLRCYKLRRHTESCGFAPDKPSYCFNIDSYNLTEAHFLRTDHKKELTISNRSISTTLRHFDLSDTVMEEVFCAVVPHYNNFTLESGIITGNCPVFAGDTRITMIRVHELDLESIVPKKVLLPLLEKEAPDFLAEMLSLELPPSNDRLNVPVITTEEKLHAAASNKTYLEMFIDECCFLVTGQMIPLGEFYDRFKEWLDPSAVAEWSKVRVGKEMPPHIVKGRNPKNGQWNFGNISWTIRKPSDPVLPKLVVRNEILVPVTEAQAQGQRRLV